MVKMKYINKQKVINKFVLLGLIVSTPTGSTAYAMAGMYLYNFINLLIKNSH